MDGSTLTCATSLSLIVDSIELLDSNEQWITEPSRNSSSISHNLNETIHSKYICRVNSTLGSHISIFITSSETIETSTDYETNTQSMTSKQSPTTQPVNPIVAASAGAFLILLGIGFILVCIISLR